MGFIGETYREMMVDVERTYGLPRKKSTNGLFFRIYGSLY